MSAVKRAARAPAGRPRRSKAAPRAYNAPALDKGLDILEFLAGQAEAAALADMAKALGRSKNELYRMVQALERRGYIARTPDDRFALTGRLFELAMRIPPIRNLHDAALPHMHALAARLEQSCHLAVRSGDEIVIVARVESPALVGFAVRVGYRRHITDSASGALLFGMAAHETQRAWIKSLRRSAARTLDFDAFLAAASAAAARGYAINQSASVAAIIDIAAPVFDGAQSAPIAALTIPFLSRREEPAHAEQAADLLVATAATISRALQFG